VCFQQPTDRMGTPALKERVQTFRQQ
jgi:hypothetical protein